MADNQTGADVTMGDLAEAKKLIGSRSPVKYNEIEANKAMIQFYAASVEDGNPAYWDDDFADREFGGIISPPGMLMVWGMKTDWNPIRPKEAEGSSSFNLPLPGTTLINVSTETEFFRPMQLGEIFNVQEEIVSISDEKTTKLGVGHFLVTRSSYRSASGELVGTNTNTLFRYTPHGES